MSETIADVSKEEYIIQSDLSDQEDAEQLDLVAFHVDWLDLSSMGCPTQLGISDLPGCRYKDTWRSLAHDLDCLKGMGIVEIFSLCTKGELYLCRVKNLMEKYSEKGFMAHQYDIEDGHVPEMSELMELIEEIRVSLMAGKKTLLHCFGDRGRSCVVAVCLMMVLDENLTLDDAIDKINFLRSKTAVSSIKQYNFVNGFKDTLREYKDNKLSTDTENISLSR